MTYIPGGGGGASSLSTLSDVDNTGQSDGDVLVWRSSSSMYVFEPQSGGSNTVRNGSGAPAGSTGDDGDFYIDTLNNAIYGPKVLGVWGVATSLVGPQGLIGLTGPTGSQGPQGATGAQGPAGNDGSDGAQGPAGNDGSAVLNGSGAPSGGTGSDGDFYIDTSNNDIYGPRTGGAWGSATSLVGPTGAQGPAGNDGSDGAQGDTGATGPQGPAGNDGATGAQGPAGADGSDGQGVPTGGTAGQVLEKIDGTDYNTQWATPSGGGSFDAYPGAFTLSTSHNITTAVSTIPFDTEVFDPDTNYAVSSGEITVTAAGYYHVSINVPVNDDGTGGATRGRVFVVLQDDDGTGTAWADVNQIRGQDYHREASGGSGLGASGLVLLSAGDVIRARVTASSSTDVSTETGEASLNIHRVRAA